LQLREGEDGDKQTDRETVTPVSMLTDIIGKWAIRVSGYQTVVIRTPGYQVKNSVIGFS
jgi:hypothetical protein